MNFSSYNFTVNKPTSINVQDVIKDVCTQIDDKIILCLFLIFTFYVMSKLILPYAREGIKLDVLTPVYDMFENMSEVFSLMSITLVIIFAWIQGIGLMYKVWAYILIGLIVLVNIIHIIEIKNQKGKGSELK